MAKSIWQARELSTAQIKSATGETVLIRPIDPEFWDYEGNIEIPKYFAEHDEHLKKKQQADEIVYHYTTLDALHGIVADGAIWASDAQHLNYALENMRGLLLRGWDTKSSQQPIDAIFRPGRAWQFVVCLSRTRDQLSQWRAYGRRIGIAIAFDRKHLSAAVEGQGGEVVDCRYLKPADFASLQEDLEKILKGLRQPGVLNQDGGLIDMVLQEELTRRAVQIATSIKHPSFAEEREVRLVFSRTKASDGCSFDQVNKL